MTVQRAPMPNAFSADDAAALELAQQRLIARRDTALGPAYRLFYRKPLHIVRGDGIWLEGADGQRYLDMYNNVATLGHAHPGLAEAIGRQFATLATHTRYIDTNILDYAEALKATLPATLDHVMFTCSGSEANDLAVRMARIATGRQGILVTANAYHGTTAITAAMSPALGRAATGDLAILRIAAPDPHADDPAGTFAASVERGIAQLRANGMEPAALCCDTLFSTDGIIADPPGFLQAAVKVMRDAGGLFIADEVQAGFGRCGAAFWGFARHGIDPDIVTIGKGMGGGYPVAGLAATAEPVRAFAGASRYFNTFGGNPVAAAAAYTVLATLQKQALPTRADTLGQRLRDAIHGLSNPHIIGVRGAGLYLGIEIRDAATALAIVNGMRDRHVLISVTGPRETVLKVRPPMIFDEEHLQPFLDTFGSVLRGIG